MTNGEIIIYTDGGSRGTPGPSACSFVVEEKGRILHKENKFLGKATNNYAEYSGVLLAMEWLKENAGHLPKTVNFYLDSELIVRQINGVYKVKDENLKKLHTKILNIIFELKTEITFKNVPREQNKIADQLVNDSLDQNS